MAASATELLEPWPQGADLRRRAGRFCQAEGRTLVLGSAQPVTDADEDACRRTGTEIVRRRTGGGAVLLEPARHLWLDVWMPRDDPLWDEDVVRSSWWLGEAWATALRSLGAREPSVHRGRATTGPWPRAICFAGMGPGEVAVSGRKLVGLAQRRSRAGALLSTTVLWRWEPSSLTSLLAPALLALDDSPIADAACGLADVAEADTADRAFDALRQEVLAALPESEG